MDSVFTAEQLERICYSNPHNLAITKISPTAIDDDQTGVWKYFASVSNQPEEVSMHVWAAFPKMDKTIYNNVAVISCGMIALYCGLP